METLYQDRDVRVDVCNYYGYFEGLGLTEEEDDELKHWFAKVCENL